MVSTLVLGGAVTRTRLRSSFELAGSLLPTTRLSD